MSQYEVFTPRIQLWLHKAVTRKTVDGQTAVSARYEGKSEHINLTPFLNDHSSVRTSKSVREAAGGFSITFADKPEKSFLADTGLPGNLESVYGLIEPMDLIEIRIWNGVGPCPPIFPIVMRGFVSEVQRQQAMGEDGRPQRQVVITGQDYGKIWQMYQVIFLQAYAEGVPLLTSYALMELFGMEVVNTMAAPEFVRTMIEKIINPHIDGFMPKSTSMPRKIETGDSISVKHGVINTSYLEPGSIYDILKQHADIGVWNELYVEDREDGVHCVYRATPALHLTKPEGKDSRKIQDDAPEPVYGTIPAQHVKSLVVTRTDANVANFYWVSSPHYDMIDEMQRKLASIPENDGRVSIKDYPNAAAKYYGTRPMYATTQQGEDNITNGTSGLPEDEQEKRSTQQEEWLDKRRRLMVEMNRDNVVFEQGTARIKGGPLRDAGGELLRAGDYAKFVFGRTEFEAYIVQIDHEYAAYQQYTTTLTLERSTGFVERMQMGSGPQSPWLSEQATALPLKGVKK